MNDEVMTHGGGFKAESNSITLIDTEIEEARKALELARIRGMALTESMQRKQSELELAKANGLLSTRMVGDLQVVYSTSQGGT